MLDRIRSLIRDIADFPKPGVVFKDITPLLGDSEAFDWVIGQFARRYRDENIDFVVAMESRGFIFGAPLALELSAGFVPVRKPGKLPSRTHKVSYTLEYGTDSLEVHLDAFRKGSRTIVIDDVLATGGTARATADLIQKCETELVEMAFLMELTFLEGSRKLEGLPYHALLQYTGTDPSP